MADRMELLCDVLDNQRRLTNWYLKKIPEGSMGKRVGVDGQYLNSPLWIMAHLIWTDYGIGMLPLGYKEAPPAWVQHVAFGSSGDLPADFPGYEEVRDAFNDTHDKRMAFFRSLDEDILDQPFAHAALGFRNNYYALLHLARHEGVHCGQIATFCKFEQIRTV